MDANELAQFFKIGFNSNAYTGGRRGRLMSREGRKPLFIVVNGETFTIKNVSFLKWEMRFRKLSGAETRNVRLRELRDTEHDTLGVNANGESMDIIKRWVKADFIRNAVDMMSVYGAYKMVDPFVTVANGFPAVSDGDNTYVMRWAHPRNDAFAFQRLAIGALHSGKDYKAGVKESEGGHAVRKTYGLVIEEACLSYHGWIVAPVKEVIAKMVENIGQFADPFACVKAKDGNEYLLLKEGQKDKRRAKVFR